MRVGGTRISLCHAGYTCCEQTPQHLVSRLVAERIAFGDGYELAKALDILVLDETLQWARMMPGWRPEPAFTHKNGPSAGGHAEAVISSDAMG
jgi:hypothetical protein